MRRGTRAVAGALLVVALTACGDEPTLRAADDGVLAPSASAAAAPEEQSPTVSPAVDGSSGGAAPAPDEQVDSEQPGSARPDAAPSPTRPAQASGEGPDLDGDGRPDSITLLEVGDMGWSFDVRLADGRATSAPLPAEEAVADDVEVLGGVDLDRDGADEVLVRTLRAVGGENAVVFRLDGDGVWLVRDRNGAPFELSTSGGMTGPRSWTCRDGEVLTRESERTPEGTYRATTWRWTLDGHVAGPLGGARDDALSAEEVSLDPSACDA